MRGSRQGLALAGAGLMALGALGPWAQVVPDASDPGTAHGNLVVLLAAGLVVLLQPFGGRGTPLVGALSAAWIALVMYTLPGDLVQQGASEAQVAWGAYLALLGALLVVAAAAWPPRSARAPARRAVLPLVCVTIACGVLSVAWTGPRGDATWALHARDDFRFESADGSARGVGTLEWHHGASLDGLLHSGGFTPGSVVEAVDPVACLWVKIEWGFALGAARTPNGYIVRCRAAGARKPAPIPLAGLGYARTLLNSATIELCVSDAKTHAPRACAWQRITYSPV